MIVSGILLCFGLGYSAQRAGPPARRRGLGGPRHDPPAREGGGARRRRAGRMFRVRPRAIRCRPRRWRGVTHVLTSIAPDDEGDPVLDLHGADLRALPSLAWVGYLGTTAVYGDRQGGWVDEDTPIEPTLARADRRARAEAAWLAVRPAGAHLPPRRHLRAGPQRARQPAGRHGAADRQAGAGLLAHPCRGHRHACSRPRSPGRSPGAIYNVCDDEPAPPQDVVAYAAELLGVAPPPEQPYDTADLSPMARTFYKDNRRVRNDRIKRELDVQLAYPNYRDGLSALAAVDG